MSDPDIDLLSSSTVVSLLESLMSAPLAVNGRKETIAAKHFGFQPINNNAEGHAYNDRLYHSNVGMVLLINRSHV